jgi:peptide/nickel transport system substrate-binding protein
MKDDHITVVKNPNYWRQGYPKLDKVIFKIMPEVATRIAAIQAGEIDVAPRLTSDDIKSIEGADGIKVINYQINRAYYVVFNNLTTGKGQPTEDVKVRQAMAYAVDIQTIIDSLFGGYATPAVGLVAESNLGFDNGEMVKYDPEKAKQLLTEAGYPDGFQMDMACPDAAYPHINEVCQAVREYFNQVGITGELNFMEANTFWEQQGEKQLPPLFIDSWSSDMSDAYERLQGSLGQDEVYAQWYNKDISELLTQIASTVDGTERAKLYRDIQKLMREDPPFVYLYYPKTFEAVRSRVLNYQPRPAEEYYLWDVTISNSQ